ncbi:TPA: P27 family phage terminase small subunit [Clostridium botulinum]|nr:P27 family phage terminase small subunit [Clostridium botulinum]HDK7223205.1 P27 family phage terminase small subunit [Clostridium botulinum]HDK7272055.1 P27 family phage terminase small subunit [Clostridium botulinum]HDK7305406.1 P27 family phage terminase small subunit [Clostridium botulinum]
MAKQQEIKKEITKLNKIFKDMDPKLKKSVHSLVENAAFMAVTLRELQEHINQNGLTCEYQNGENQWGTKKSPEVEVYNTMIKNFISAMKQITDFLPKESASKILDDGFDEFVNNR